MNLPDNSLKFQDYTILIIDDNPTNLNVLVDYLEEYGFEIMIAKSGEMGLKRVKVTKPNIILLDVMMPGIDGFETCRQLKADENTKDIPIIFMTALDSVEDKVTGFELGAVDYVTKPIEQKEVLARINTHLNIQDLTYKLNHKIEELTLTRKELVQSEKMASLGRLVAGFAHELNTPLGVAIGSASTLQIETKRINEIMEQEEVDVDELLSSLDSVDKSSNLALSNLERAANLVTSFKRTAIDQTSDEFISFKVKELVDNIINLLHNHFKTTAIEILVDCSKELIITSIPGALEQIITNLLMNSLIHGFNEGLDSGTISINIKLVGEILHLEYSDTGKGIAQENLEKIFEPFFTTNRANGGSGLGMYICYNLITNQLKGDINCESTSGKGSIFKIDFPTILKNEI
ncbi:hybrid sensor histidine kinase/response regulator [Candidatus Halobeggiatoa sp. HSG11]|nr:hybrid sensor histidine kinase/response regulator [Candidatus Halobeggiatoa sp. HSG11]